MKKLLAAVSLCMALFLLGGFTMDDPYYQRAEVSAFQGKAMGYVQVDDPESLKRLDAVMWALWTRSPVETPADTREEVTIIGDRGHMIEHAALLPNHILKVGQSYYSCTEGEAGVIRALLNAPSQKKQAFWRLMDAEQMVAEDFCAADSGAAEALQSIISGLPAKYDIPADFSTEGEWMELHLHHGSSSEVYLITPEWIKCETDYVLYYPSSPELYEKIKQTAGAQNLKFDYPKSLRVERAGRTDTVTDPAKIRAILEPFQNMRPTAVEEGLCGTGMVTLTLDGGESFSVVDMETLLVHSSKEERYYAGDGSHSAWLQTLPRTKPEFTFAFPLWPVPDGSGKAAS